MIRSILIAILCLISTASFAQLHKNESISEFLAESTVQKSQADTSWKKGGLFALNVSQVSLNNWAAGGTSSMSGIALVNLFANYEKGRSVWDNSLDLAYGLLKQNKNDAVKSDDKIDFASKYGQQAWNEHWYYTALLNFRSQFFEGLDAPDGNVISEFLAPAYLIGALGLDFKPNDNFSILIAPVTAKYTFVNNDLLAAQGAYGVEPGIIDSLGNIVAAGSNSRSEFGGSLRAQFKKPLMENVDLLTRMDLFSNYEDNPDHIDVNWEALIGLKVNKYISATVGAQALYDHDIAVPKDQDDNGIPARSGKGTQFKEFLNLGFLYNF